MRSGPSVEEGHAIREPTAGGSAPRYEDHIRLWADELKAWVPDALFDAHVHLGPPEVMGPFSPERLKEALSTFASMTWEELSAIYPQLYSGKRVAGVVAFPWPLREVDMEAANLYIIEVMKRAPEVRGFLLSHPTDVAPSRAAFDRALSQGVRFSGVKPYFDLLGKSNYESTMPEFIPEALLELMDAEGLVMMLHTSGRGMGVPENQAYVRSVVERYPRIRIILAHMGRYLEAEEFFRFCDSGLLEHPSVYVEMSSASRVEVYERALQHPEVHGRLLFGSDLPFGLLTGVEAWSEETGPVFITRDRYTWSDERALAKFAQERDRLTYNTYHTIKAFKDALARAVPDPGQAEAIKRNVFYGNAAALFDAARA